jgi:hypothetical protein
MNFELFDKAVAFIASRADAQLNLKDWQCATLFIGADVAKSSSETTCGTIACAGGWLGLNPEFEYLGMSVGTSGTPTFGSHSGYHALSAFLGLPYGGTYRLFSIRSETDRLLFGAQESLMTDRQLWLSRARIVREVAMERVHVRALDENARMSQPTPNTYKAKATKTCEAFTFDEMLEEGRRTATETINNGVPWSFVFKGYPVTHERDDMYWILLENGSRIMSKDRLLVIARNGAYVAEKSEFEAEHERVTDSLET